MRWIFTPIRNLKYPTSSNSVCTTSVTSYVVETRISEVKTVEYDGSSWSNACYHYSSVSREHGLYILGCPNKKLAGRRPAVERYRNQRTGSRWYSWVSNKPATSEGQNKCNRDEYPPFRFLGAPNGIPGAPAPASYDQWIRFLPSYDNIKAGQLWNELCDRNVKRRRAARLMARSALRLSR